MARMFCHLRPMLFLFSNFKFWGCLENLSFFPDFESVRLFRCKQLRYIWDEQTQTFHKLKGLDMNVPARYLHQRKGLSCSEEYARRLVYGPNEITIPFKNIPTLLFLEVLNPYYVFQVFSVILWMCYSYYYYAVVIVIMSIFGITMSIIQTRKVRGFLCINKNFSRTSWQFPESKCPSWYSRKQWLCVCDSWWWECWTDGNALPGTRRHHRNPSKWVYYAVWCSIAFWKLHFRWSNIDRYF